VLSPLLTALSFTPIETYITLPKLHPLHEKEDRHYVDEHIGRKVQLHRTLRQRWLPGENRRGDIEVFYKPDFPLTIDVFEDFTFKQAEEWERERWSEGIDVEAMMNYILQPRHEYLAI
jgi:hypothetical protein